MINKIWVLNIGLYNEKKKVFKEMLHLARLQAIGY